VNPHASETDPLDPWVHADDKAAESALRPGSLAEFAGQPRVSSQPGTAATSPSTCCCRVRPGWARRRWR
jgi:hypothetical protein